MLCSRWFVLCSLFALVPSSLALATDVNVLAVDRVGESGVAPAADILSVSLLDASKPKPTLRIAFLHLGTNPSSVLSGGRAIASWSEPVSIVVQAGGKTLMQTTLSPHGEAFEPVERGVVRDGDALLVPVGPDHLVTGHIAFSITTSGGDHVDAAWPADRDYAANCALVLHGNQGLGYTDVFHGRADDLDGSGFDEAMQVHELLSIPVNIHLSGTLMTAADWAYNQGDPLDFNGWLASGVSGGWVGMLTSAYAQHIMPFVRHEMNEWAVHTETQMVIDRYGTTPTVAWIPERVWLNTSGYPSAGVSDWIGDNWQSHGVGTVILDDDVHLQGHDNHQIHTLAANGLRLVPRDRQFTGHIIGGNGQAALDILTGLAGSGVGEFRIAVLAEDWEAVAEIGGWAESTPNANETYNWFVNKCATESAWLSTWTLANAVTNPDFNGDTFNPTPGTYWEIGGTDGYGGGDNGWYTHWASWVPYATGGDGSGNCAGTGGNCKNYGSLWNDAYNALLAAPDNNISQAGWYVLMTMLYETGWHDGMGGPISGWEHNYSGHIKQANIYAEAARWADGQYAATTAAFFSDIDNDGYGEVVMHNDRMLAVFESIGGRCTNLFIKGPGYDDTAIGVDNAYWSGTTADYNDDNHRGAFSDVSPTYVHDLYDLTVLDGDGADGEVVIRAQHGETLKEFVLKTGEPWLEAVYRVGPTTHWVQAGWSPSLVDLVWNAEMDRVWTGDQAYMGQRNPNTGVTAAWVLGSAGASFQGEFAATIMKGDEIYGNGTFAARLYAGVTSAPSGGDIAELRAVADTFTDTHGPRATSAVWNSGSDQLRITFDQYVAPLTADPTLVAFDEDGDNVPEVTLGATAAALDTGDGWVLFLQLDASDAAAVDALDPTELRVLVAAGAVEDTAGNESESGAAPVSVAAALRVTIDGQFELDEWPDFDLDDAGDSEWTAQNEIEALHATWDETYLYIGLEGIVHSNSWIIYLDIDPGSVNGQTDLTSIDAWERGATFSAPGFAADFQYAAYQHQSQWDSQSFWELLSPLAAEERSDEVEMAFDPDHLFGQDGGSELAIPWHTLYGLGDGNVPAGASVSIVASICWDPEPDGELGGDSAPSNSAVTLPEIDAVWTLVVDDDGDGAPDDLTPNAVLMMPASGLVLHPPYPNPFNPSTTIAFDIPDGSTVPVRIAVYDARGRCIDTLVNGSLPTGHYEVLWQGRDFAGRGVAAGTYFCRLERAGLVKTQVLSLIK